LAGRKKSDSSLPPPLNLLPPQYRKLAMAITAIIVGIATAAKIIMEIF
jgi:hypothetical protein